MEATDSSSLLPPGRPLDPAASTLERFSPGQPPTAPTLSSITPQATLPPEPARPSADKSARDKGPLRRRALLGAAGLLGVGAIARLARGGDLTPPVGPITPTGAPLGAVAAKIDVATSTLSSKIDSIDEKVAHTPQGVSEPRTPISSLPSSAGAQFVITQPGAYYLTSSLTQMPGKACIEVQADHVDIDGQGFVFHGGGGGGGGGSSCIVAVGRQALELYDCAFAGWQGRCCDLEDCDDVYLSDILLHACVSPMDPATGSAGALLRCRDRCGIEDVAVSACTGGAVEMRHSSYIFELTVTDSTGRAARCGDGCCVEASHFIRVTGDVIVLGDRCSVSECDMRQCDGLAVSAGSACVIECCECAGGAGGGIRCADGCCVEDCSVVGKDGLAIECGSRSSVTENHVVSCWGISCASECECCDNDLSDCSGGPDALQTLGGAITIHGGSTLCEGNFVSNALYGITIQQAASSCHVHDNTVTGAGGGGVPGTLGGAGILFHDAATGCLCTSNHVQALPGTAPYVMGTASHGPIVVVTGGDISALPGSSHPLANLAS